jgi:hypothetical protein
MFSANVLKVMIASPSDVPNERRIAREVVHEWNVIHSEERATVLIPVAWETHASPLMGDRPQEVINDQLLRSSDLLVAIFWTRLGTPTGKADSGTVEEVESNIEAGKPTLLYFSSVPVRLDSVDEEQYRALLEFKESCRVRGLFEEYESIAEFKEKLSRQLAQTIIREFSTRPAEAGPQSLSGDAILRALGAGPRENLAIPTDRLSADAKELLVEAAKDSNGTVLIINTMGGAFVETNNRNFVDGGSPRSEARWRQAVRDLVGERCLEQRDSKGEVFSLTATGYRLADLSQG